MITPVPNAKGHDLLYIIDNLAPQNVAEMEELGLHKDAVAVGLAALAAKGYSEVEMRFDTPIAAFGVTRDGDFNDTWFVATAEFFDIGIEGIRFARSRVFHFRWKYGLPLRSVSWSPLAVAPKWFRLLGFVEQESGSVDGPKVFVYK